MRPHRPALPTVLLVLVLAIVVAACGAGGLDDGDGPREWRGLALVVPDGWTVINERTDLLQMTSEDIRLGDDEEFEPPEDPQSNDVVGAQFIADPTASAEAWRELVLDGGGTIESDERIEVGGLPATSITYEWTTNGVPTRERVVFVPSRQLYALLQPVPVTGQTNAPDVYDRYADELDSIIESIEFGRPFDG